MDDQQSYLLNGLLTRQFSLGRILRFRQVTRGRQAITHELLTAEHREFLVHLFPSHFPQDHLTFIAQTLNKLDVNRFTVVPFIPCSTGQFVAEGPQNTHMLVSLATAGSFLSAKQFTHHDITQVGLRLAWLHRLLKEQLPFPPNPHQSLAQELRQTLESPLAAHMPPILTADTLAVLYSLLDLPAAQGWVHGDFQLPALLHDHDHQLRTIVDWALLHYGSPLEDLVDAFLELCMDHAGNFQLDRGRMLLESYHSLQPIQRIPWTPIVASWLARQLLNAAQNLRPLPPGFPAYLKHPENLATSLASCV